MGLKQTLLEFYTQMGVADENAPWVIFLTLLFALLSVSLLVCVLFKHLIVPIILHVVGKTSTKVDDYVLNESVLSALSNVLPALIFYKLLPYTYTQIDSGWYVFFDQSAKIYIAIMVAQLLVEFLSNLVVYTDQHQRYKGHHIATMVQFFKLMIYCVLFIVVVALVFGRDPINVIAGMGAAATVLMLVFKDSILGFVAGIQLSVNNMVKPGDWVTISALNIDGVIEKVSLTTVKIRNFDNTISTVPPYRLTSDTFQNWDPMFQKGGRRVKRALYIDVNSIRFMTEDELRQLKRKKLLHYSPNNNQASVVNLTAFRHYVEYYLHSLPYVIDEDFVLARQLNPTQQGLPLEIWFYSNITAFARFESLAAETIENIISIMPAFGLRLYQSPSGVDFAAFSALQSSSKGGGDVGNKKTKK